MGPTPSSLIVRLVFFLSATQPGLTPPPALTLTVPTQVSTTSARQTASTGEVSASSRRQALLVQEVVPGGRLPQQHGDPGLLLDLQLLPEELHAGLQVWAGAGGLPH